MPNPDVEQSLCDALDAAGRDYERAVRQIEEISREIAAGRGEEPSFARLQQIAGSTRQTEDGVARLREVWNRQGRRPGSRLQAVLRRQEEILRELIRSLDQAERVARSARGTIMRVVDDKTKSHQMHTAYARTVRQAVE
ncbi:MAG: hypothetical protein AB7U20_07700 [Planctomycetaceae bacterium]